jgi:Niemann-Pick C1 protein
MPKPEPGENHDYKLATGIVLTFLLNNKANKSELGPSKEWEKLFVDRLVDFKSENMDIAYMAERSIEDGIDAMSEAELWTVIISYLVMFFYITIALGKIRNIQTFLVESKITLAIGGIVIVLASVLCSLGVFGYLEVATTMLTVEVIPFLVLAVGVDNIFILVHTYNRLDKNSFNSIGDGIGEALGRVGPSILLTAASECFCFLIGALSDMPAVRTFALYATVALLIDFIFQISAFIALMAIDQSRLQSGRLDLLCCFKTNSEISKEASHGFLQKLFEKFYTPFLMAKATRIVVVLLFLFMSCFSLIVVPSIEIGLDQELSMPKDSHIVKYFQFMADLLSMVSS